MKIVSAAEANRQFSKLMREAQDGATIVVTSHGEPVVTIARYDASLEAGERARRLEAWRALQARIDGQPATEIRWKFNRDELYDD